MPSCQKKNLGDNPRFLFVIFNKLTRIVYMSPDRKKYILVFLITLGIFIIVFGLVSIINRSKIENIDDLQRKITIDLIATETKFDLLKTVPCKSVKDSILLKELNEIGEKLSFAETNQGSDDPDVQQLKKNYSLLQVKDYLLMQEIDQKCNTSVDAILYFYSSDCDDCRKQGYVLTEFKKEYPNIRIYSFDTDLDFSVIETFTSLYDFEDVYPTLIINDKAYQKMTTVEELEELFPELVKRQRQSEILEKGIEFIQSQEEYKDIAEENIVFEKQLKQVFTYRITPEESETKVVETEVTKDSANTIDIVYNEITKSFSLQKDK
jgi:thiol-disulfide isomerase/thioredoxin